MAKRDVPIVRIVVEGCPAARSSGTNVRQASRMLLRAFEDARWPGKAMFAVAPGGFVVARFPGAWDRGRGWDSRPDDFEVLLDHAEKAVGELLTPRVLDAVRGRAEYLTLGVDLNDGRGKQMMDRTPGGVHAELVAIVDVERCTVQWSGKSYPVSWQERTLVQEANLKSHLFDCGKERVLVLGCHDLHMFSARAKARMKAGSQRHRRSEQMRNLTRDFGPTMILHHPHSTDSPRTWATAWGGASEFLPESDGRRHVWASGIAYYNGDGKPRGALCDVLRATRCCEKQVVDIVVVAPLPPSDAHRTVRPTPWAYS